jgi:hypothetical protein
MQLMQLWQEEQQLVNRSATLTTTDIEVRGTLTLIIFCPMYAISKDSNLLLYFLPTAFLKLCYTCSVFLCPEISSMSQIYS